MTEDNDHTVGWYARRNAQMLGPYAPETFERYVLLGRIRLSDRVSCDGEAWYRLADRPDLLPTAMQDLESPAGRARYEAARRQVEERRRLGWRWVVALGKRLQTRSIIASAAGGLVILVLSLALVGWQLELGGGRAPSPNCEATAAPGVDWSYCIKYDLRIPAGTDLHDFTAQHAALRAAVLRQVNLRGAVLRHADLQNADLRGTDLRDADLRGADLRGARLNGSVLAGADLRDSDLRQAEFEDADLSDARLTGAAWASGRWCGEGSVGECRR